MSPVIPICAALALLLTATPTYAQTDEEPPQETVEDAKQKLDANQKELLDKQAELKQLEAKISELSSQHNNASAEAELAADQLAHLSKQLQAAELELKQTSLSVIATRDAITTNEAVLADIEQQLNDKQEQIKDNLKQLYQHEQTSIVDVLFGASTLGELLAERRIYRDLQKRALQLVGELHDTQTKKEEEQEELHQKQNALQQLRETQSYQQASLADQELEKEAFLKLKQSKQATYSRQLVEAKQARSDIEQNIFTLQGIGIELAITDAFSAARFASSVTGVRPSLLLAIVKVETNVGENLGSGIFPDDMHPASREAFIRLTQKLGLDPHNTPISRRPRSYRGWGGAIGPGQFLPDTWERLELRIADLSGKPLPDPFELADSLVGIGIMMADRGATDPANETEAVARYLAGPNWQYHTWYSNRVLAVASEYQKEGLE